MDDLFLRKLQETDFAYFRLAWDWMQQRPDLYGENEGFRNYYEFVSPPETLQYFGLFSGRELIALASFRLEGKKACRFGLIAPPRPRFRAIATLLQELQRQFFTDFGGEALWICVPPKSHEVAQKLVGWFHWKPVAPGLFTYTVFDFLNHEQQKNTAIASHATAH